MTLSRSITARPLKALVLGTTLALATPALASVEGDVTKAATSFKPMVGSDLGGGVILSAVEAEGKTLRIDVADPTLKASDVDGVSKRLSTTFNTAWCAQGGAQFYAAGAALRIRVIGPEGVLAADTTLTSC